MRSTCIHTTGFTGHTGVFYHHVTRSDILQARFLPWSAPTHFRLTFDGRSRRIGYWLFGVFGSRQGSIGNATNWRERVMGVSTGESSVLHCDSVPSVFLSDDERPRRKAVAVRVSPGQLVVSHSVTFGDREHEYTFSFVNSNETGLALIGASWYAASFGLPFPITSKHVSLRGQGTRRGRLTITPPRPLDFTIHLYQTSGFDVEVARDLLLGRA